MCTGPQLSTPGLEQDPQFERILFGKKLIVTGLNLFQKWLEERRVS